MTVAALLGYIEDVPGEADLIRCLLDAEHDLLVRMSLASGYVDFTGSTPTPYDDVLVLRWGYDGWRIRSTTVSTVAGQVAIEGYPHEIGPNDRVLVR